MQQVELKLIGVEDVIPEVLKLDIDHVPPTLAPNTEHPTTRRTVW